MIKRLNKGTKQENHKDEIRLITPPCNNGGGIIDVEVLPNEYGWVGTPITKDTKRVYFNINLSPEKIANLQNYIPTNNASIIEDYGGYHNISFYNNEIDIDFGDYYLYENSVWNKSKLTNGQYLDIDWEIHYLTEYNVKLVPLFSSTPFEKVEINTNSIYRLPDGSLWVYYNNEWKELGGGSSDLIDSQDMSYNIWGDLSFTEDFEIGKIYRQREKVSDTYVFRYIKDGDEEYISCVTDPEGGDWGYSYVFETLDINNITEETKFTDCITGNIYSVDNILDYPVIIKSENKVVYLSYDDERNNPYYLVDYIEAADNYDEDDPYNLSKGYKVVTSLDEAKEGGYLYIKYGDIIDSYDTLFVPGAKEHYNSVFLQKPNGEYIDITYPGNLPSLKISSDDRDLYKYPENGEFGFGYVTVQYGTKSTKTDFSNWASTSFKEIRLIDTSNATNMYKMFKGCKNITTIPLLDTRKVTNMGSMFVNCTNLTEVPPLTTSNVTTMNNMFYGCANLTTIPLLDTSKVTDMQFMFQNCTNLTSIPKLDTSNVTDISSMFDGCTSLISIPELDTSNATDVGCMFQNCTSLISISQLYTSNATNISRMFYNCSNLISVPELDTSNATDSVYTFASCKKLVTIPELDLSKATRLNWMFKDCTSLTSVSLLNTNNVTEMKSMFEDCTNLTSISELDTSNVTDMYYMFENCKNLTTIPALDVSKVINFTGVFAGCTNLKSILMYGMKVSFYINSSTKFEREDLVTILNNLATVTTTQTLTMGSTNLAKLTDEDKAIATNKGWTLA